MAYAHVRDAVVKKDGEIDLRDLPVRAGTHVRVLVIVEPDVARDQSRYPLHGTPVDFPDPFSPAMDPDEWEANR